ncbi:glycosyltransferase, partial [Candidatus Peregrinibacteria bacterium]|nr:glycosyltransferase [Candidatus Peregrinibacteria bacterium]
VGNSPLPDENTKSRPAAGLRTEQFIKPLIGHYDLRVVTIAMPECYDEEIKRKEQKHSETYRRLNISKEDSALIGSVQKICDEFHPDAIISVNTFPSYIVNQLDTKAPIWADLNGWIMAEAQAQAYKMESNAYLAHYWNMERSILERADKFSAVSVPQTYAVTGELAALGRLNAESFAYKFVHHIPNASEWFKGEDENAEIDVLKAVPKNVFVLLWVGGYNTWIDEVNLFKGLTDAMKKCPNLYFVSTGGSIERLENKTFEKFRKMVDESELKDRFVFLGWVESKSIPYIYKRADAGINVDRKCVETLTGARNRINEMMKFGLPVISTLGSEIAQEVEVAGAGITVASGQHELLTDAICEMYEEWHGGDGRQSTEMLSWSKSGQEYVKKNNYKSSLAPLLNWLENPRPAPDRGVRVKFGGLSGGILSSAWRFFRKNGLKKFIQKLRQRLS